MKTHNNRLSVAPQDRLGRRIQMVVDFWMTLEMSGDAGATTWEVLSPLRDQVTQCLSQSPPDVLHAEGLTAKALFLTCGLNEN